MKGLPTMLDRLFRRKPVKIDPVCGMQVDVKNPTGDTHVHEGETFYFCADGCRRAFEQDPESFLTNGQTPVANVDSSNGSDPTAPITFRAVEDPTGEGKFIDVEYQCLCGCTPGARVESGSEIAGSEHCCCGRVHFAGDGAEAQIRAYMESRAETNMDDDVGPYVYEQTEITSSSGTVVTVSYAQPLHPRK